MSEKLGVIPDACLWEGRATAALVQRTDLWHLCSGSEYILCYLWQIKELPVCLVNLQVSNWATISEGEGVK